MSEMVENKAWFQSSYTKQIVYKAFEQYKYDLFSFVHSTGKKKSFQQPMCILKKINW